MPLLLLVKAHHSMNVHTTLSGPSASVSGQTIYQSTYLSIKLCYFPPFLPRFCTLSVYPAEKRTIQSCSLTVLFLIIKKHKLCHVYNNTNKIWNKTMFFLKKISGLISVVKCVIIPFMFQEPICFKLCGPKTIENPPHLSSKWCTSYSKYYVWLNLLNTLFVVLSCIHLLL